MAETEDQPQPVNERTIGDASRIVESRALQSVWSPADDRCHMVPSAKPPLPAALGLSTRATSPQGSRGRRGEGWGEGQQKAPTSERPATSTTPKAPG
jgi:hypothetical protein